MWGRAGGGSHLTPAWGLPRRPLSCAPGGSRGHGPSGSPDALASSARQRRALRSLRVGLSGPGGPAVPGRRYPVWAGRQGLRTPAPTLLGSRPLPSPRHSRTARSRTRRKVSSAILQKSSCRKIAPGLGRVGEATGAPQIWTPQLQFSDYLALRASKRYVGHVGATFKPHRVIRLFCLHLARLPDPKHVCSERRLRICLL